MRIGCSALIGLTQPPKPGHAARRARPQSTVQCCPRRRAGVARDERTTDAVGNSCQALTMGVWRPQIVRKNRNNNLGHGQLDSGRADFVWDQLRQRYAYLAAYTCWSADYFSLTNSAVNEVARLRRIAFS